jgi:hypothetical protein
VGGNVDLARVLEDPDPAYRILLRAVGENAVEMVNRLAG